MPKEATRTGDEYITGKGGGVYEVNATADDTRVATIGIAWAYLTR